VCGHPYGSYSFPSTRVHLSLTPRSCGRYKWMGPYFIFMLVSLVTTNILTWLARVRFWCDTLNSNGFHQLLCIIYRIYMRLFEMRRLFSRNTTLHSLVVMERLIWLEHSTGYVVTLCSSAVLSWSLSLALFVSCSAGSVATVYK